MWHRVDLAREQIAHPWRRQAYMFRSADRQLREIRLSCGAIARRDLPIEASGKEASLPCVSLHPKGQEQHLSCRSCCSQSIAEIDRKVLGRLSTRWWDEIGTVDSGRSDLQLCHLCVNAPRMLGFRGQKTCCCGDYARRLEHAGSPRIRGYTNILENACHCEKVLLIAESDP